MARPVVTPEYAKQQLQIRWNRNALSLQERLRYAVHKRDDRAAKNWAIAGGIATEKSLLLDGQPTTITLHAHRHDIAELLGKLATVAKRVGVGSTLELPVGTITTPYRPHVETE